MLSRKENDFIQRFLKSRDHSEAEYNCVDQKIESIKEEQNSYYYVLKTKMLNTRGKYSEAIELANEGLEKYPGHYLIYYNKFTTCVMLGDYEAAYNNFSKYKTLLTTRFGCQETVNLSLPLELLRMAKDIKSDPANFSFEGYQAEYTDSFANYTLSDSMMLDHYYDAIKAFNSGMFEELGDILNSLQSDFDIFNLPIEINSLKPVVAFIREFKEDNKYDDILNYNWNTGSILDFSNLVKSAIDEGKEVDQVVIQNISQLSSTDHKKANKALRSIFDICCTEDNYDEYSDLYYKIKEDKIYSKLDEISKKIYDSYLQNGVKALDDEDYDVARGYFQAGYYTTFHPLFKFYIGKTFYELKNYGVAEEFFESYYEFGGSKGTEAKHYLTLIESSHEKELETYAKNGVSAIDEMMSTIQKTPDVVSWNDEPEFTLSKVISSKKLA